jgi:hypothetical protein
MTNESITITSKFNGKCKSCGGLVAAGSQCKWTKGAGVRHVVCPVQSTNGSKEQNVTVTMGVFRKDGKVYVVKPNREKTRCYAKEIVESPARMTENGEVVDFEAIYRPGMIYNLSESDRWNLADAADFLTKYSKCIVCNRGLKAAKSVAAAIGPVCAKYFAHSNGSHSCEKPVRGISAEQINPKFRLDAIVAQNKNKHDEIEDEGQRDEASEDALENKMLSEAELREDRALYGDAA